MRRVISLWLPRFSTDRLSRNLRKWRVRPFVTTVVTQGDLRIAGVNPHAQGAGVMPGMALADARTLVPNIDVTAADPAGDAKTLAALAAWCGQYTPWTAPEGADGPVGAGVWLDVTGCAHLFGGEQGLLEDLIGRVERLGYDARAGIADTPGAAWGITRFGRGRSQIVAPSATREALGNLPVAALRLPSVISDGLGALGLRLVRDLYDLPRGPLTARFGARVTDRLDAALNPGSEPVSPMVPVPERREHLAFAEPIGHLEDIERGLEALLIDLCVRMERESVGARRVDFALYRVDGGVSRARIGTSRPARDAHHLARLFAEQIQDLDLGLGVEAMAVCVPSLEPLVPEQIALVDRTKKQGGEQGYGVGDPASIAPLVDRLINRLGSRSVVRLSRRQSHIPERAAAEIPAANGTGKSDTWTGACTAMTVPGQGSRPLRLFPRPQSVQAVAPVPDGPPALFRWRRVLHRITRAEGPERIAPEWWRTSLPWDAPWEIATRDYYRVEDEEGRRFWLYRKGLYPVVDTHPAPDAQALDTGDGSQPTWFIHGQFA